MPDTHALDDRLETAFEDAIAAALAEAAPLRA